ncbi:hypothetical protein [Terrabacter sp. NPDC080008]|uniref:hypothetical protein n=1 Tax=Terrabacter sp. NPDC080008 TaxID=3155176 RepID=UPI00344F3637
MTPIDPSEHPPAPAGGPDAPPVGSVAQEAALLVDLLSRGGWSGLPGMPAADSGPHASSADHDHRDERGGDHREDRRNDRDDRGQDGKPGATRPCTCGGTTPSACRVCPVCQLVAFVQQVNPDTIEKVADLVGFAATALHDLATAQRERQAAKDGDDGAGPEGGA